RPVEEIPVDLTLHFGAMPGRFSGVADEPLLTYHVGRKKDFQLDLADLSAKLKVRAAPAKDHDGASFRLTPGDVRFVRVSTGASSGAGPLMGLAVAFWDQEANGSLVP